MALLCTAQVYVEDVNGRLIKCRAFLDNGSQANLISAKCVKKLGIPKIPLNVPVTGVGAAAAGTATSAVNLRIVSSVNSAFSSTFQASILPTVTSNLPTQPTVSHSWPHIENLLLADPSFHEPGEIDILIGVVTFNDLKLDGVKRGPAGTPLAEETSLGWVLSGAVEAKLVCNAHVSVFHSLDETLRSFWENEELPPTKHLTLEQQQAEDNFVHTHQRTSEGRYVVELPFNSLETPLGDSKKAAYQRLLSVERTLARNPAKRAQYEEFMDEYLRLGHMKKVTVPAPDSFYLPHHAVCRESSTTTKLRVVFDASAKTTTNVSLNNKLLVGPTIQDDLFTLLVRFRKHKIGFTADIAKMFRQIVVHPKHTPFQRILWRKHLSEPVQEYELLTVTYGTSAAPFLSTRCLKQLAYDEKDAFPDAAKVTASDFYVDDLISGVDTLGDAKRVQRQLEGLMKSAGLNLRKWSSNSEELMESIPEADREKATSQSFQEDDKIKTLGIRWSPSTDMFFFTVQPESTPALTKREMLSDIAKVFDPLGWLSPVTIRAKMLLQELWLLSLSWDSPVPTLVQTTWNKYRSELMTVSQIRIPRCVIPNDHNHLELHGFSDASEKAISACIYLRSVGATTSCHLIAAKTKVAPLKTVSLPRLELCGAHLMTKLLKVVKEALHLEFKACHGWTDSTIVLSWLQAHPSTWKCFVANRVSEIQSFLPPSQWSHVRSLQNPADCASRGITPTELLNHALWWTGPEFLLNSSLELFPSPQLLQDVPEKRTAQSSVNSIIIDASLLERFSSLSKLKRVTAWIFRFVNNCKHKSQRLTSESLTSLELEKAEDFWTRAVQHQYFYSEITLLTRQTDDSPQSPLRFLHPFLDKDGILRVGGRLNNAEIPIAQKNPIVLPKNSHLTHLIITHFHLTHLHAGLQLTQAAISSRFWIIGAKDVIRRHIRKCVTCHRFRPTAQSNLMADLPLSRVTGGQVFMHTGSDFCGPFNIRSKTGRCSSTTKGYVCLFVCMATRALHLELTSDMSSASFIAALKRFIAVRGKPAKFYCDNGSNYVGASRELQRFLKSTEYRACYSNALASEGIDWNFNPPAAPHFGGLWEAGVKSVKHHLRRTTGEASFTYEEFSTVLKQVEACVNSRPLCPLSPNPDDCQPLTPGHFLIGKPITSLPERDFTAIPVNRLQRWEYVQQCTQHFWKRWSAEYLVRLQQRPKWWKKSANVKVDDLVLIKEVSTPLHWKLARIQAIHPAPDGIVRVVTLKTSTSTYIRPITSICPLPFESE